MYSGNMLYGHVHNTFDEYIVNEHQKRIGQYKRPVRGSNEMVGIPCQMINCFCMFSDYVPLTLDEWIQLDKMRRVKIFISDYETAEEIAEGLGLREGQDFFLIKDNCLTELEPEEVGDDGIGRTLTCIGFRPLPDEVAHKISKKYQLYK